MKKFIIMSLTALFALSLAGCGKGKEKEGEGDTADGDAEAKLSYIMNNQDDAVTVNSGDFSVKLAKNECASVKSAEEAKLKVSVGTEVACDNSDENKENDCGVSGGKHYEVGADKKVKALAKNLDNVSACKPLAKPADDLTITALLVIPSTGDDTTKVKVTVGDKSVELASAVAGTGGAANTAAADGMGCVKVKKADSAKLKITKGSTTLCDNTAGTVKCLADNLEVKAATGAPAKAAKANANCKAVLAAAS